MRRLLPILVGTMLSTPALALDTCAPTTEDQQTRVCVYNPLQRYAVTGLVGYPINLSFGSGEVIKRSEFAYTAADEKGNPAPTWQGPKCGDTSDQKCPKDRFINNVPIWPYVAGRSSLIVVTSLDGQERPYRFDLTARAPTSDCKDDKLPGCPRDTETVGAVSFVYPADVAAAKAKETTDKKQAAQVAWRAAQDQKSEQTALARMKTDPLYGPRNFNYKAFGDQAKYGYLAPSEVSDNGWLTEFQWPGNVQVPAITVLNPVTGEELAVIPDVQGSMHIVNRTAEWFRLRIGHDAVLDIHNKAFKPDRPDPRTGTTSPDVIRTVVYKGGK